MNAISSPAEKRSRFQFSLSTALVFMVWLCIVLGLWLNVVAPFAFLFGLVASYVIYRCMAISVQGWTLGNTVKVTLLICGVIVLFYLPTMLGLGCWMFRPMINRQVRNYASELQAEIGDDERFDGVVVSTGKFKGHEHVRIDGKVPSKAALEALELIPNPDSQMPVYVSVEVDEFMNRQTLN